MTKILLAGAIAGAIALASLFAGFEIGKRELPGASLLQKIDKRVARITGVDTGQPRLESQVFYSTLLGLDAAVGVVPTGRDPRVHRALSAMGGGLTSFGDDVLLLAYNGRIYAASSTADIRETAVVAPDNNRRAYQALKDDPSMDEYAFDPHYLRYNDLLFVDSAGERALIAAYTEYHTGDRCFTNTLAKLAIPADAQSIDAVSAAGQDWKILYRTSPCLPFKTRHSAMEGHMAGGRLAFRAPREVLFTSGDFHLDGMRSDGPAIAQDREAEYGKVISVDIVSGVSRIVSSGHRNPQGIVVDSDGNILVTEHGPKGGDELNLIIEGRNYGWPRESLGISYTGQALPESPRLGRHDAFEPPLMAWVPSVAISGLAEVSGFHDAWDGDLLASSMLGGGALHRIRRQDGRVVYSEPVVIGSRVRYVLQHTNGQLVLWTDNEELVFISPRALGTEADLLAKFLARKDYSAKVSSRLEAMIGRCSECHSFELDDHTRSPSLARIYNAPIGATSYTGYSAALKERNARWTPENLAAFIADPQAFVPGTSMPPVGEDDTAVIDAMVEYLDAINRRF